MFDRLEKVSKITGNFKQQLPPTPSNLVLIMVKQGLPEIWDFTLAISKGNPLYEFFEVLGFCDTSSSDYTLFLSSLSNPADKVGG